MNYKAVVIAVINAELIIGKENTQELNRGKDNVADRHACSFNERRTS